MPGSSHHGLQPRATNTRRGEHPDLFGDMLMPDVSMTPDPSDRDRNRAMADGTRREHFMQQVAAAQALEPPTVQAWLSGNAYGGTFSQGIEAYTADRTAARQWAAHMENKSDYWDDARIAQASLEEYDQAFDAAGRPRDHVYYHPNRSFRLNDQIDPHSARENLNR